MNINKLKKEIDEAYCYLSEEEKNHVFCIVKNLLDAYCVAKCGEEIEPWLCRCNLEDDGCPAKKHFDDILLNMIKIK